MNAVAACHGAGDSPAGCACVADILDHMPERAAGVRRLDAGDHAAVGAAGAVPAFAEVPGVASLAGDMRLSNRREVLAALGADASTCDADLALRAYMRMGDAFVSLLTGDFAIAIVDRAARRLVAARDHLGLRPLYYRRDGAAVRIASELRALVARGDRLDEGYLAEALAGDIVDLEATPYAAVRRVPPAHLLIADARGVHLRRYWEPSPVVHQGRQEEHEARFRAAFDEAVRACCEGESRVGVHLSGGLDSSSVLGTVAANAFAEPVPAGHLLPWPEADERAWIEAAAARWSLSPVLVEPAVNPAPHDLGSIRRHGDLPDLPNGAPLFAPLHAALVERGVRVVLTGFGGDQWWSGESAHMADLVRAGRVHDLARWMRAGGAMGDAAWSWRSFAQNGLIPLAPAAVRRAWRRRVPSRAPSWIAPDFAGRVALMDRLRRRPDTSSAPSESWRRLRWRIDSGEEAVIKERIDRMAAAHGVDLRHPMYDRRLVELALATPDTARIRNGRNRVVLRGAMTDRLSPQACAREGKADLTRLLIAAARHPDLERHLDLPRLRSVGWIRPEVAAAIVSAAREQRNVDAAYPFWNIVGMEAWLDAAFGAE